MRNTRNKALRRILYVALSLAVLGTALWSLDRRLVDPYWPTAGCTLRHLIGPETAVTLLPKSALLELRHFHSLQALVGEPPRGHLPPTLVVVPGPAPDARALRKLRQRYRTAEPLGPEALGLVRLTQPRQEDGKGDAR